MTRTEKETSNDHWCDPMPKLHYTAACNNNTANTFLNIPQCLVLIYQNSFLRESCG